MVATTYCVQAGSLSRAIHVGRINVAGTGFLDKPDLTPEVLNVVAEWVEKHYDGSQPWCAWVTGGSLSR
ncbi:hypothetical protein SAMN06295924_11613 [Rathayibacter rathayi NCPPB 2980 = VKM Ac-1601]|nr:hypothetical protein FB469_3118 [Rathayibacter rathayi]SOE05850.1 hypothetical protein SAMN06295924_11613 [Rathayibacter rathayi NCPPB 2980 = VKM Ac-1601]